MRRILKIFIASVTFVVLLLGALPLLDVPSILSVSVETPSEISLATGDLRRDGSVGVNRSRRILNGTVDLVLPNDVDFDKQAIGFENGPCDFVVKSVVLKKWCVFPFRLDLSHFSQTYEGDENIRVKCREDGALAVSLNGSSAMLRPCDRCTRDLLLSDGGFLAFCAGLIFSLTMLVIFARLFNLDKDRCVSSRYVLQAFLVSFLFAVLICIVVPIQSYVPNQHEFTFKLNDLVPQLCRWAVEVFVVMFVALNIIRVGFGRIGLLFFWTVSFIVYLNAGVLSWGCPELDGNLMLFANFKRAVCDSVGLSCIFLVILMSYRWCRQWLHWMAIGLLVMVGASMLDIKDNSNSHQTPKAKTTAITSDQLLQAARFSSKRNILLLIVDAVTTEIAQDVFEQDPSLFEKFTGFTFFTNNIGMHATTILAVPGFMTGKYRSEFSSIGDFERAVIGPCSFIADYMRDDIPIYLSCGGWAGTVWSNRIRHSAQDCNNDRFEGALICQRMPDQQAWNLWEISRFRIMPFALKYYIYGLAFRGWPIQQMGTERFVYSKLKDVEISDELDQTLHVYHTEGAHAPYLTDRNGRAAKRLRVDYAAAVEKGWFVFKQLARLCGELKKRGLYDKTVIAVIADHGSAVSKNGSLKSDWGEVLVSRTRPLMFVKPEKSTGRPVVSRLLTSHSRLATLMRYEHTKSLGINEISSVLHVDRAIYQAGGENVGYKNIVFTKENEVKWVSVSGCN